MHIQGKHQICSYYCRTLCMHVFLKCCWADSIYILHHGPVAVTQMKSFNQSLATQPPTDYIPCAPSLNIHRMHRRKWQALLLFPV